MSLLLLFHDSGGAPPAGPSVSTSMLTWGIGNCIAALALGTAMILSAL